MKNKTRMNDGVDYTVSRDSSTGGGFLTGSGSDNGSRITCGTTNRGNDESGRSMVEMLGTLAIMGVLAIGGVAGYRWAMDKYKANDILNEVRKRAVVASQQRFGGSSTISFAEYGDNKVHGYTLSGDVGFKGNNEFFTISVANVDKEICENLIAQEMPLSVGMQVNDSDEITCADGATNTVAFGFSNTLDPNADVTAGGTQTPTEPAVEPCEDPNQYRDLNGECIEDKNCAAANMFFNRLTRVCTECPDSEGESVANSSTLEDTCEKCTDVQRAADAGSYSYCVYCPSPRVVCKDKCCAENQRCQYSGGTYTCVSTSCKSDSDCTGKVTANGDGEAICDTYTGQCKWGCKDNVDCDSGSFCDLDVSTTGYSCTQKPGSGVCKAATLLDTNGLSVTTTGGTTKTWYRSKDYMNWWSAENFCKAIGKGSGQLIDPKDYCESDEWSNITANNYGYCEAIKLSNSSYYGWTKRLTSSCNAFYVLAYDSYVYSNLRYNNGYYYALCE